MEQYPREWEMIGPGPIMMARLKVHGGWLVTCSQWGQFGERPTVKLVGRENPGPVALGYGSGTIFMPDPDHKWALEPVKDTART